MRCQLVIAVCLLLILRWTARAPADIPSFPQAIPSSGEVLNVLPWLVCGHLTEHPLSKNWLIALVSLLTVGQRQVVQCRHCCWVTRCRSDSHRGGLMNWGWGSKVNSWTFCGSSSGWLGCTNCHLYCHWSLLHVLLQPPELLEKTFMPLLLGLQEMSQEHR